MKLLFWTKLACQIAIALVSVGVGAQVDSLLAPAERRLDDDLLRTGNLVDVPPEEAARFVDYEDVLTGFFRLDWFGAPPPAPPEPPEPPRRDARPLYEHLTVTAIHFHAFDPEASAASVRFHSSLLPWNESGVLRIGDRLPDELSFARVTWIGPVLVELAFDPAEGEPVRAPERLRPPDYESRGIPKSTARARSNDR